MIMKQWSNPEVSDLSVSSTESVTRESLSHDGVWVELINPETGQKELWEKHS